MRSDRYKNEVKENTNNAKTTEIPSDAERRKKHPVLWIMLVFILAVAGFGGYRGVTAERYPSNAKVNGIPVGGMTVEQVSKVMNDQMNTIQVHRDQDDPVTVNTKYNYDTASSVNLWMRLASIDPKNYFGSGADYTVSLDVTDGIEETAKSLEKALPDAEGVTKTADAYVNYDTMKIVKEVEGNSTDYSALSEDIAAQRSSEPRQEAFEFASSDYIASPKVLASDLQEELKFAKYYLADGLTLTVDDGSDIQISPKQLATVILYTENGPEYSEEGAKALAQEIADNYSTDLLTVETQEGSKSLINYVLEDDEVDIDKTAESILDAAKDGGKGKVIVSVANRDLSTRVEVSISTQTVYYVKNNKVVQKTSVVTGSSSNPTPRGIFELAYKERNVTLTGPNADGTDYASKVSYWMPFNGGIGFHDASWRSSFGGNIYVNNGSHGCINMPPAQAQKLYESIDAGILVYVYD